jgi:carboxymethylenebutenolidase
MNLKKVDIESENKLGPLPVYVSDLTKNVGIIVIQEWWGVNEQIKNIALKWFGSDYVTLVPDLYRGRVASDRETAGHYFKDLNWNGAIQDIQAAVNYLRANGVEKIGVTGFCMGGALSIGEFLYIINYKIIYK